ncbi:MAG TPA: FKBP-type peptidyl-prolyl cis-trans isomerase [Candidatus Paceibacterota bacterium]
MDSQQHNEKTLTTPMVIGLGIGALVIIGVLVFLLQQGILGTSQQEEEVISEEQMENEQKVDISDLLVEDLIEGDGQAVVPGDVVVVHYTGTFEDGIKFDSSYDRGEPAQFQIGVGQVIQGWDIGLEGMKIGGKRKLTIPSHLAYGEAGRPGIPPNSTLIFEIELLQIVDLKG